MKIISLDMEVFYSSKLKYTLKSMIVDQFVKSNLFDPYLVSVSDGAQTWSGEFKNFNWQALDGACLVSHNARFDETVYLEMVERGLAPKLNIPNWFCSADLTSYICNRRALDHACEHLLKVKLSKADRKNADGRHWPTDFSLEEQASMIEYARKDAHYCWLLWDKFSDKWPEKERRLSMLTRLQGRRGVQIDTELLEKYLIQSHQMKLNTEKLLPWLDDSGDDDWSDFNAKPTSTKCIAEQCRRSGIPCPPIKSHHVDGEELYSEWEMTYTKTNLWISALSSWRSVNRLHKTFVTVKERLRDDGTLPFALKYAGAHTLRWSGDSRINFQNFRKKPILCNEFGLLETDEKRQPGDWVLYSIDIRNLIVARPGKSLIVADASQIEPRVLAWLSGNHDLLKLVATGVSLYEAHARTNMGWTAGDLKVEAPEIYALAKAQVLALGYGAGWEKFIVMAHDYTGQDFTKDDPEFITVYDPVTGEEKQESGYGTTAKAIVKKFREENPKIVDLWKKLDESFKRSIGGNFTMAIPGGRKMTYECIRCEARIVPDLETGKPKRKTVFTCSIGGRRVESYGGKITENLVQSVAREVFADGLLRLEDAGMCALFTVHDEVILEVADDVEPCEVERLMSITPAWVPGLPLAATASKVSRYQK